MQILIESLEGDTILCNLAEISKPFVDDDVIYIGRTPCRLSSARPYLPEIAQQLDRLGVLADNPNLLARLSAALNLLGQLRIHLEYERD